MLFDVNEIQFMFIYLSSIVEILYAAAVFIRLRESYVWQGSAHTSLGPIVTLYDCTE